MTTSKDNGTTAAHTPDLYSRIKQNRQQLSTRFPSQFAGAHIGHDWPDGWHALVEEACLRVAQSGDDAYWVQIKEKFGGLRLYLEGGPIRADIQTQDGPVCITVTDGMRTSLSLHEQIDAIEKRSFETCVCCGGLGRLSQRGGWLITLCPPCGKAFDAQPLSHRS